MPAFSRSISSSGGMSTTSISAISRIRSGTVSRTREAGHLRLKATQDLENARRQAEFSTRQAFLGVTNGMAQVKALEQAAESFRAEEERALAAAEQAAADDRADDVVLAAALGDYATSAPMDTFMEARGDRHPTDLAGLRGARFVA